MNKYSELKLKFRENPEEKFVEKHEL